MFGRGGACRLFVVGRHAFLGNELSADPFELFATRIAKLQLAAAEASGELDRHAETRFDVSGDRAEVGGRVAMVAAPRPIGPHPVLRLPDGQMLRDDHLQALLLGGLALERDERARVSRADHSRGDRGLYGGASTEQAEGLGDGNAMLAETVRDVLVGEPELLDQPAQSARLFHRVEVGALQVFDETEHQLPIVAGVAAHHRGHRLETGEPRGTPPALAGDQLISVGQWPDEQRLEDAVQANRLRQLAERLRGGPRTHLLARRAYLVDRDHLRHQRLALPRHGDQRVESAAEPSWAWLAHRSSSSFASAG